MNLGFKLRPKWWYRFAVMCGTAYEIYRAVTFRPITDAEAERMALWIADNAMRVDVTGL